VPRSGVTVLAILLIAAGVLPLPLLAEAQAHLLYLTAECLALAASWLSWSRMQAATRRPWFLLLVGWSISGITDLLRYAMHAFSLPTQTSVLGHASTAIAFAIMGCAALMFSARRVESGTRALLLDTGVLTVGLATPLFALRVLPQAGPLTDRVSVVGYATVSLLSLVVCARFVMAWRLSGAPWLVYVAGAALANGVACLLAADAPASPGTHLSACRGLWVLAYGLGFAAISSAAAARHDRTSPFQLERPSPGWVAVLVLSMAMPGVTLAVAQSLGRTVSLPAIAAGSVALAVLVSARMATLVAHLHGQSVRLSEVAVRDELTGIPNRRGWNHALAQACRLAEWDGRPFSLAVLDLDHFKAYNDAHGHQAGDVLLTATAHTWRQLLPADAVLARYGGEEFTLLLFDADLSTATHTLHAMRTAMTSAQTFSAGLTRWRPGIPAELLFAEADQALYHAKHLGRDQMVTAAPRDGDDEGVRSGPLSPAELRCTRLPVAAWPPGDPAVVKPLPNGRYASSGAGQLPKRDPNRQAAHRRAS
jgi:diguanylate cyclase (GGDEF)-like protein